MDNVYYVIVRQEKDGGRRYVNEIARNSVYLETDYTLGLRFRSKEATAYMCAELNMKKDKDATYIYIVAEVRTSVSYLTDEQ